MANQSVSIFENLVHRYREDQTSFLAGGVLLLIFANFIFLFITRFEAADAFTVGLLTILASLGVFFLVSLMLGTITTNKPTSFSEELAARYLAASPQAVVITEAGGKIIYGNRSYHKLTGLFEGTDYPVESLFSGYPGASGAIYRLARAGRKGQDWTEEFRLAPGGKPNEGQSHPRLQAGWYRIRVRRLFLQEDENEKIFTVWEIRELTAERHRQEKTFQDMQHIINYFDHAPAGFFTADAAGQLQYVNTTLAKTLGYKERMSAGESLESIQELFYDDPEVIFTKCVQAQDKNTLEPEKTIYHDLDMVHRNKERIPVRLVQQYSLDDEGQVQFTRNLVLFRQGEARDQLLGNIQASENCARLYESVPIAIATLGQGGVIRHANTNFLRMFSHVTSDFIVGKTRMEDIVNQDARSMVVTALDNVSPQVEPIDIRFRASDQAEADIRQRNARLFICPMETKALQADSHESESGDLAYVFVIDMTEQVDMRHQVEQGQKMAALGQFAGGIAHDFNNVLQAVIGFSDLLLANHTPESSSFRDIIAIKSNASRAAGLVKQILAFSRGQTLRPSLLDLNSVVRDLENVIRLNDKVVLDIGLGRDLWDVKVDRVQLEQVILNLSKNAMDAMPDGGRLSITTSNSETTEGQTREFPGMMAGEYVLIEVTDTGSGMPADVIEKIFEPFFTTKEVGKGTGLGLSSVYGIIKQTGGFIYPVSEVGSGTTFSIYLPRYIPTEEEATIDDADIVSESGEKTLEEIAEPVGKDVTGVGRILLVEDEESVRAFSERALANRGYEIISAMDGEEGFELFEEYNGEIDLVISDVMMPVMDGPTLIKKIRDKNPDLKAILMSGWAEDQARQQVSDDLEVAFMPKPFTLKELAETVKKVMDS